MLVPRRILSVIGYSKRQTGLNPGIEQTRGSRGPSLGMASHSKVFENRRSRGFTTLGRNTMGG